MSTTEPGTADLHSLAASQDGYFTAEQAGRLGFDPAAIRGHVASNAWTRVERNLFRLDGWPTSELELFAMWCAWFEGEAVISHQSAAELHGFGQDRKSTRLNSSHPV